MPGALTNLPPRRVPAVGRTPPPEKAPPKNIRAHTHEGDQPHAKNRPPGPGAALRSQIPMPAPQLLFDRQPVYCCFATTTKVTHGHQPLEETPKFHHQISDVSHAEEKLPNTSNTTSFETKIHLNLAFFHHIKKHYHNHTSPLQHYHHQTSLSGLASHQSTKTATPG